MAAPNLSLRISPSGPIAQSSGQNTPPLPQFGGDVYYPANFSAWANTSSTTYEGPMSITYYVGDKAPTHDAFNNPIDGVFAQAEKLVNNALPPEIKEQGPGERLVFDAFLQYGFGTAYPTGDPSLQADFQAAAYLFDEQGAFVARGEVLPLDGPVASAADTSFTTARPVLATPLQGSKQRVGFTLQYTVNEAPASRGGWSGGRLGSSVTVRRVR